MTLSDDKILAMYEELMDGQSSLSQTLEIQLANIAKSKLETELRLEICKKLDTSNSTVVNGTYLTQYSLPADFATGFGYLYVDIYPYMQIPLEQRETNKYNPRVFYIDQANRKFYICGTQGAARTITFPYIYRTSDISAATVTAAATTVTWPDFHDLIPMEMAKMQYVVDAGDKGRSWMPEWQAMYMERKASLQNWDAQLKLTAIGNSTPYGHPMSPYGSNALGIPLPLM